MVVKIALDVPAMTRRKAKNIRIAMLSAAGLLTLVAISCVSLGLWRVASDLDRAGDFVFPVGFLSHWQVWIASAAGVQYASWRLTRYLNSEGERAASLPEISPYAETLPDLAMTSEEAAGA
jgi:hypothetical protein